MRKPIKPLRGKNTLERNQLAQDIWKFTRKRYTLRGHPYLVLGRASFEEYLSRSGTEPYDFLKQEARKGKVRFLDIGPGDAQYIKTANMSLGELAQNIEFHTISPEHINPRFIPASEFNDETKTRPRKANPNYTLNFQHHIGAIETYPTKRLGKFTLIYSNTGGTVYTRHFYKVIEKISRMLKKGGWAFVEPRLDIRTFEAIDSLKKILGKNFRVRTTKDTNKAIMIVIERVV